MPSQIDESARIVESTVGDATIREYVTIHDSEIGDGCRIYEHSSVKKSHVAGPGDINAGVYVENAALGPHVQLGPNCSVVGVSHELAEDGMTFREDVFDQIILGEGVFVGAGAVIGPGVELGERTVVAAGATVTEDIGAKQLVRGTPPEQEVTDLQVWLQS
jgi:acetyltransferase-like isoleucine patch superfamily enzyme